MRKRRRNSGVPIVESAHKIELADLKKHKSTSPKDVGQLDELGIGAQTLLPARNASFAHEEVKCPTLRDGRSGSSVASI